jgi:hypothetical protein
VFARLLLLLLRRFVASAGNMRFAARAAQRCTGLWLVLAALAGVAGLLPVAATLATAGGAMGAMGLAFRGGARIAHRQTFALKTLVRLPRRSCGRGLRRSRAPRRQRAGMAFAGGGDSSDGSGPGDPDCHALNVVPFQFFSSQKTVLLAVFSRPWPRHGYCCLAGVGRCA